MEHQGAFLYLNKCSLSNSWRLTYTCGTSYKWAWPKPWFFASSPRGYEASLWHHLCLEYLKHGSHGCLLEISEDSRTIMILFLQLSKYQNWTDCPWYSPFSSVLQGTVWLSFRTEAEKLHFPVSAAKEKKSIGWERPGSEALELKQKWKWHLSCSYNQIWS